MFLTINAQNLLQNFVCIAHAIVMKGNQTVSNNFKITADGRLQEMNDACNQVSEYSDDSLYAFQQAFSAVFVYSGNNFLHQIHNRWHPSTKDVQNVRKEVLNVRKKCCAGREY